MVETILSGLEALLERGRMDLALRLLLRPGVLPSIQANASRLSPSSRQALANACVEQGARSTAVALLAAGGPDDASAMNALAQVVTTQRCWDEALTVLPALAAAAPMNEQINGLLVFALLETGNYAAAAVERDAYTARRLAEMEASLPSLSATDAFSAAWHALMTGDGPLVRRWMAEHCIAATDAFDLAVDTARGLSSPGEPRPAAPAGPRRQLVLAMTVRDELDLIEANLAWHFAHGIDAAIVTDNGSRDGTRERLAALAERLPLVVIDEPVQDMDQSKWSTRMVWLAREAFGAEWVLLADADEFFHPTTGDYRTAIASATQGWFADATILYIHCYLMLLDAEAGLAGAPPFHAATHCLRHPLARWNHAYVSAGYNLLSVMTQIQKIWVRADSLPIVLPGNHLAITHQPKLAPLVEVEGLHFSYRDFGRWHRKVTRFVEGFAQNSAPIDRPSVDYWRTNAPLWQQRADAEAIYRRLQFGTAFHQWLKDQGRIIQRLDIAHLVERGLTRSTSPFSPAEQQRCAEVLGTLDPRLPRCLR
ncbi:MAG: glycosyltransferase family 2 protein [Alphaproteobacteria bacterium]|nr:glycosyltransferase family 2 protein [Alphaproteobacteria bacterium]